MDVKAESEENPTGHARKAEKRRLELSVAQVAGSAMAAVAAAVLASKLGVYGTILGAGVVSVVATTGGSVFQHLFRRTGEQLREAKEQAWPAGVRHGEGGIPSPEAVPGAAPTLTGEYGAATVHGTRLRGWKRPALAAGTVFILAMGTVTGIELFAGGPLSNLWGGDHKGTTVSNSVPRSSGGGTDRTPDTPGRESATPHHRPGAEHRTPTPTPSHSGAEDSSPGGRTGNGSSTPAPAPSTSPADGGTGTGGAHRPDDDTPAEGGTASPSQGQDPSTAPSAPAAESPAS
ncbi:hypothetical protein ACZ90_17320 [Streptomyces albus subsp. albus]|nr:hypothetical protein ACZ90_17320 [Streptomyces albus subsp. albus]